jgi:hypothetical protein
MTSPARRSDLWILYHLPKTGGGTISQTLRSNEKVVWPIADIISGFRNPSEMPAPSDKMLWQGGHVTFGLHEIYDAIPRYMVVLREPIDRLISEFFYAHAQSWPGIFLPEAERLPAFIRFVEAAPHLNYYSHMLSDYCFVKEGAWEGTPAHALQLVRQRRMRFGFLATRVDFAAVDPHESFGRATGNLATFAHVGRFEDLAATAAWFESIGLSIDLTVRVNVTLHRPAWDDLPDNIKKALAAKTEADHELYREATRA